MLTVILVIAALSAVQTPTASAQRVNKPDIQFVVYQDVILSDPNPQPPPEVNVHAAPPGSRVFITIFSEENYNE